MLLVHTAKEQIQRPGDAEPRHGAHRVPCEITPRGRPGVEGEIEHLFSRADGERDAACENERRAAGLEIRRADGVRAGGDGGAGDEVKRLVAAQPRIRIGRLCRGYAGPEERGAGDQA